MVTNLTNLTGATDIYSIVVFDNQVTGGIMGMGFIIVIFMMLTMNFLKGYDLERSVLASSFLSFMLSIMMTSIGLLNYYFIIAFGVIMAFDGFYVYISSRKGI